MNVFCAVAQPTLPDVGLERLIHAPLIGVGVAVAILIAVYLLEPIALKGLRSIARQIRDRRAPRQSPRQSRNEKPVGSHEAKRRQADEQEYLD
jgi:hypothetical protein